MATIDTFDDIEETCTVTMTDATEKDMLTTSLQAQIDKYNAQIESLDKETDYVEVDKRNKFQNYLDRVNEFIMVEDILLLTTKGELQSWSSAINEYYVENKLTLTAEEITACTTLIDQIDTALISIDRKT